MMEEEISVHIDDNAPSLERTLRPIVYVSWLLGVGVARPHKAPKFLTVILRVIHFGVCSVIVAYGAIDFFTFGNVFKSDIYKIMYYTNKVVCYVSSYYYVLHVSHHYDKWPELMRRINDLDRKIKEDTTMNDRAVRNGQILAIIATIMLGPLSLVIHAVYYYFTLPQDIFASDLLLYYTIAQTCVNSFVFDIVVYAVCGRFRKINEVIERLDERLVATWIALKIRRIRELHNGICDLVTLLNEVHGIQLLMCSANSFTMVVATLFRIYMGVVEKNYEFMMINNIIWMIYTAQFAITCWVCTLVCREAHKTGTLIHTTVLNYNKSKVYKFTPSKASRNEGLEISPRLQVNVDQSNDPIVSSNRNSNYFRIDTLLRANFERDCIRNEVNDFTAQLQEGRVAFTACDLFEMNNSLVTGFVGVITTYLIILVQFYRPEGSDARQYGRRR